MELKSIEELRRLRRKLVKLLEKPVPHLSDDPIVAAADAEIWQWGVEATKRTLRDIDAEIHERTGGLVDPERDAKAP